MATVTKTAAATRAAAPSVERVLSQAGDVVRRDARRLREMADRARSAYHEELDAWARMKARLDLGLRSAKSSDESTERLRVHHESVGRELAAMQVRLKRLDIVARQLEVLGAYLVNDRITDAVPEPTAIPEGESEVSLPLRIIHAQEGERQRLAEAVHDGPAQVLTNAIFQLEYLDRIIDNQPRAAHTELAFLRTQLREGLDEVRSFIANLRPPLIDVGLVAAIGDIGSQFATRSGVTVEVAVNGMDDQLTPDQKASVLRIVQEALQNIRKHAAASEVRIVRENGTLVIGDNGRGFDVMRLATGASRNFGLQFMRERAELMGATLEIESRQGEGTRILLRLPSGS